MGSQSLNDESHETRSNCLYLETALIIMFMMKYQFFKLIERNPVACSQASKQKNHPLYTGHCRFKLLPFGRSFRSVSAKTTRHQKQIFLVTCEHLIASQTWWLFTENIVFCAQNVMFCAVCIHAPFPVLKSFLICSGRARPLFPSAPEGKIMADPVLWSQLPNKLW